jgi:Zn-finger nucleic acid-binding protein
MNCPHCPDTVLVLTDRQNVQIDDCPQYRGTWLGRRELDKLQYKAAAQSSTDGNPSRSGATRHRDFADAGFALRRMRNRCQKRSWLRESFD